MADETLDCTHLSCPLPIVEITRAVRKMKAGQTVEVQAKDRAFRSDVEAWARRTNNEVVEFTDGEIQTVLIRVS